MHLDVAPVSANASALPQHVLRGLHRGDRAVVSAIGLFASARPTRIASCDKVSLCIFSTLCLSTSYADCIRARHRCQSNEAALPQHVLRGLHRHQRRGRAAAFRLCISTSYADCIVVNQCFNWLQRSLHQHVLRGLHPARQTRICRPWTLHQHVLRGLHQAAPQHRYMFLTFASARPTRIASAKTHKVRLAFMTDGAVSR